MARAKRHPHAHLSARKPSEIAGPGALVVDEVGAEALLGVSRYLLRRMRNEGRGPALIRLGRLVRYRVRDLEKFIDEHREESSRPKAAPVVAVGAPGRSGTRPAAGEPGFPATAGKPAGGAE